MDNFFANMFRQRREAPTGVPVTTDPAHPSNQEVQPTAGGGSFAANIITARSPQMALTVSAVYRATELRMKTMGVMPVQYRKKDFEKGNFYIDMRGLGKRLNYLLQQEPNPIMSAPSMWELVTYNQIMYGNGLVYIERDEIDLPCRLWLVRDGAYNVTTGEYVFLTFLTDAGYKTIENVPRRDVMHFPNTYRRPDGIWGIPTIQAATESLSLNKTLKNQALETAAKGGRIKGFIGEEKPAQGGGTLAYGLVSKQAGDDYAQEIQQKIHNGQDIVFLRGLDKWVPLSMTGSDMQTFEQLGGTYDDVARFWATPRPLLMLDTNSHYNDYQNATMEYHTRTILPEKNDREKEIARKLIGMKEYGVRDIHICEKPLLAMDPERKAKVAQMRLQAGLASVNELRAEDDMPSVEKGDIIYVSTNLAELGSEKLSGNTSTTLKPGQYTVGEPPKEGEETA